MWRTSSSRIPAKLSSFPKRRTLASAAERTTSSSPCHHLHRSQRFPAARPGLIQPQHNNHAFKRECLGLRVRSFASASDKSGGPSSSSGSNWFIRIGWALLGLVVVDQALQFKQEREDAEKRQMLYNMQIEADAADANSIEDWDATQPTLFRCKLLHVEPSLDGTKMLTRRQKRRPLQQQQTVKAGDVVEVLEAGVGPNQAYHLCRLPSKSNDKDDDLAPFVGWYPIQFLQKVDEKWTK